MYICHHISPQINIYLYEIMDIIFIGFSIQISGRGGNAPPNPPQETDLGMENVGGNIFSVSILEIRCIFWL